MSAKPVAALPSPTTAKPKPSAPVTCIGDLFALVARHYGMGREEMLVGRSLRQAKIRQAALLLASETFPNTSLCRLSRVVRRDHSTVLYNLRAAKARQMTERAFREDLNVLRKEINRLGVTRPASLEIAA